MSELTRTTSIPFFSGFQPLDTEAGGVRFAGVIGGHGPPVLLHGYPQTHIAWRRVAPALALSHTVIIPDLPGYEPNQANNATMDQATCRGCTGRPNGKAWARAIFSRGS